MPLIVPIILGGIAAATATTGVGLGIKGLVDSNDANTKNKSADDTISNAKITWMKLVRQVVSHWKR